MVTFLRSILGFFAAKPSTEPDTTAVVGGLSQGSRDILSASALDSLDQVSDVDEVHMACLSHLYNTLTGDGTITFLQDNLAAFGWHATPETIQCVRNDNARARSSFVWKSRYANVPDKSIVLFEQNIRSTEDVIIALRHELIHAFDSVTAELQPSDCRHAACSEIRAYHLSGECSPARELRRSMYLKDFGSFRGRGAECVRRRAEMSISQLPKCKDAAADTIEEVFDRCYRDFTPFTLHRESSKLGGAML